METCEKCGRLKGFGKYGTGLKPSYEPIIIGMKPLDGTYVQNAQKWGVAGINIDDSRIGERWPSNFLIDEGVAERIDNASRFYYCAKTSSRERNEGLEGLPLHEVAGCYGEFEGDGRGRQTEHRPAKNNHPTVKPLALMRYLITLISPPSNALILDPFAGSGSTVLAAKQLGISALGIEKQPEYAEIAKARVNSFKKESTPDQLDLFD